MKSPKRGWEFPGGMVEPGESLEVGWFQINEVIQMMGNPLYKTRITNMLSRNPNMYCYAFKKEPFSFVATDEFKIGL